MGGATLDECFGFSGTKAAQQQSESDSRAKRQSGRKIVPPSGFRLWLYKSEN